MHPHLKELAEKVFLTSTRWPHYSLLLNDLDGMIGIDKRGPTLFMERDGPRFRPCFPEASFLDHGKYDAREKYQTFYMSNEFSSVIMPNLLHHVYDQLGLFDEIYRISKKGAHLYIFDALLREIHQAPYDYIRYTPCGIKVMLENHGFDVIKTKEVGNVYEAILYCAYIAQEYPAMEDVNNALFPPEWMGVVRRFALEDIGMCERTHTRFPVAWSVLAEKVS